MLLFLSCSCSGVQVGLFRFYSKYLSLYTCSCLFLSCSCSGLYMEYCTQSMRERELRLSSGPNKRTERAK